MLFTNYNKLEMQNINARFDKFNVEWHQATNGLVCFIQILFLQFHKNKLWNISCFLGETLYFMYFLKPVSSQFYAKNNCEKIILFQRLK